MFLFSPLDVSMTVRAGREVVVEFRKFDLLGDSASCGDEKVVISVGGKKSIDFCGSRTRDIFVIKESVLSESGGYLNATVQFPIQASAQLDWR